MKEKLKELYRKYKELSFPIQYFILSIVGSLGGSAYIVFISEYATYYYAWEMGFRVPAEGVPYLSSSIGAISFFILIAGLFIFSILIVLGESIRRWLKYDFIVTEEEEKKSSLTKKGLFNIVLVVLGIGTVLGGGGYIVNHYDSFSFQELLKFILISNLTIGFIITVMYKKGNLIILSAIIAVLFSILAPIFLFNTDIYGKLIKELGYGGELPIVVNLENNNTSLLYLYLRTGSSIFLSEDNKTIVEYPISAIKSIQY